ncbi:MAG: hypothetical protein HKO92_06960 [Flavobacteriaceae bacterium]|nr:hypothetical protein [Flavobacteriaceae bacterium]
MPHILKNNNLEINIDLPEENYNFSRFDWTGKISKVCFKGILVSTIERTDDVNEHNFGKAFYNEFGIDTALGFQEAPIGGWFHKIGVGLLKKKSKNYNFFEKYEIKPAHFEINSESDKINIKCISESISGYSYVLIKTISLLKDAFNVEYSLQNTGSKNIVTDEYIHNFTAIDNELIGLNYVLKFPFNLKPELFSAAVNKEGKVEVKETEIKFKSTPKEQFFFSNLSGNNEEAAKWELINLKSKIVMSEEASFRTSKINLWGWQHVISPELFYSIELKPGQIEKWSRKYTIHSLEK